MRATLVKTLDYVLLTAIGLFCWRYMSSDGRLFAERHIQLQFLDFPIFVGEFLLLGCSALFALRLILEPVKVNRWHGLIVFYFVFICAKAFFGYIQWGPLALRDAALFYYFAFAVIAYGAYRREFFNDIVIMSAWALLLSFGFASKFNDYWFLGRLILAFIFCFGFSERRVGALMALGIILCTPYTYFTMTARTFILANFLALAYFMITLIFLTRPQIRLKVFIGSVILLVCLAFYMFYFANYTAKTIFQWKKMKDIYAELQRDIEAGMPNYRPEEVKKIHLYNPDLSSEGAESLPPVGTVLTNQISSNEGSSTATVLNEISDQKVESASAAETKTIEEEQRMTESNKLGNAIFRLFMWRDILDDLNAKKPLLGFDFGKPFRSKSLEVIHSATGEWTRDGWISMHNSYLNIIYRSGFFGVAFIGMLTWVFFYVTSVFIRKKSLAGLALCAVILNWFVAANFAVILELPYTAIPIWALCGVALGHAHALIKKDDALAGGRPS